MSDYEAIQWDREAARPLIFNALTEATERTKQAIAEYNELTAGLKIVKQTGDRTAINGAIGIRLQSGMRKAREERNLDRLLKCWKWVNQEPTEKTIDKEALRELLPMREVVERYQPIVRGKTLCPAHSDRKPSMHVYEKAAYCFTCGAHLDVFGFVMAKDKCSFPEALKSLAL